MDKHDIPVVVVNGNRINEAIKELRGRTSSTFAQLKIRALNPSVQDRRRAKAKRAAQKKFRNV